MALINQKINLRKKIRLGVNSAYSDGYLSEMNNDELVIECYESFPEETVLKCEITVRNEVHLFEFRVNSARSDGLSYKLSGRAVKNLDIIKRFYKEKIAEQEQKSVQKKKKWKFW